MLAWALNLDFAAGVLIPVDGPYRAVAGAVWHPGADGGSCYVAGGQVGRVDTNGATIGQTNA